MGYFKKKIILTVLGILILIALFSCVSYFTFALSYGKKQQKTSAADLTISTLAELQAFADNVNNGNSYSGKTVVLSADIDCGGVGIAIGNMRNNSSASDAYGFGGVFDGNGKTISNFIFPGGDGAKTVANQTYYTYGLFRKINNGAIIKNLRVANVSDLEFGASSIKNIGVIVGYADGGNISNCVVENVAISADGTSGTMNLAGIFAVGYANVSNCLVQNLSTGVEFDNVVAIGPAGPSTYQYWYDHFSGGWYKTETIYNSGTSSFTCCVIANLTNNSAATTSFTLDENSCQFSYCISSANITDGLDLTNTWYYHSGYNEDYPYLRKFMSWSTFYFDCNGDGEYETTRTVPSDLETITIEIINRNLSWNLLVVGFADSVQGASATEGKHSEGWEMIDDYHYKYAFIDDEYILMFCTPICDDDYIEATVSINGSSQILNGPTVTDSYIADDKVKYQESVSVSVEYSATETKVTYTIGNVTAVYTFSSIYYLDGYGQLDDQEIVNGSTVPDATDYHVFLIRPNIKLKTYTPDYQ